MTRALLLSALLALSVSAALSHADQHPLRNDFPQPQDVAGEPQPISPWRR